MEKGMDDSHKGGDKHYTNRLINEDSPYLQQHAHNPVDWFPWGDEAFDRARADDKPIFLSIGYSTCHWCHVMEHESFDNPEIARFLNDHFVSIKLDREQRPDLDDIYMTGVQLMSGQGGWPMSNFLNHDGQPFHAGTYYPPDGFLDLLQQLSLVWRTRRTDVMNRASEISRAISQYTSARGEVAELSQDLTGLAAAELVNRLDELHGGFGGAPKFPNESQLLVLMDDVRRHHSQESRAALILTLNKMYQGGIYDQVAGGFHRYTVDREWLVPHFEKMLYNQAQLLSVYSQAWSLTGDPEYRRIAIETGEYVLRDMTTARGGFYSATDADSEGEEGLFFLWRAGELQELLDDDDYRLVQDVYGVSDQGNFEGRNILNLGRSLPEIAVETGREPDVLLSDLNRIKKRLYLVREQRIHPLRDEKIITGWNGMMISAFAMAGQLLELPRFIVAARDAADMLLDTHLDNAKPMLWRVSLAGHVSIPGNLEDYACLAEGLLRLYHTTVDLADGATGKDAIQFKSSHSRSSDYRGSDLRGYDLYKSHGLALVDAMNDIFRDDESGGYFLSRPDVDGPMITRPKSPMDGAMPSANSVALRSLVLAYQLTGDIRYQQQADRMISSFSGLIQASPSAFSYMIRAISDLTQGSREQVQFAASGHVRVQFVRQPGILFLDIAKGWHITCGESDDGEMIAMEVLSEPGISDVVYPDGEEVLLGFSPHPVLACQGSIQIKFKVDPDSQVRLRLQACNDHTCLMSELLVFN